ncbi:hypothetical protein SARC_10856 [Sphaeroforma arctica JP610]|uniref:Uncharacterized protein n=1 Tax=Sphaeroforma arctica JP610 TaxID=667725 RepID=A0A0L0FKW9_9EUKA|nr:hypothetical protein SARC_10856 [Sphaeroforma arctica JP610]KNC76653.1 hypothetical protein SARC_10856 [Sphaeroforma arctica JP610]|eukprot:XP_014150555.1 hypothetical protein SARC_10856 [Sphaeroforma arctica JP610]
MNSITENMTTEYGVNCTVSAGEDVIQTLIEQSGCALKVTTVAGRGKGLVATSKIEEGTVIACESPLLCMQNNIRDIVTCACCCATVGSIMQQIDVAARVLQPVDMDMDAEDDWKLPTLPSET